MNRWSDPEAFGREAAKVESRGEALMLAMMWPERDGWSIVTQYPIPPYRIDIAVPELRLAVEVNSFGAHGTAKAMAHDAKRRTDLALQGWETVELPSQEVFLRGAEMLIERVLPLIAKRLPAKPPAPRPSGSHRVVVPLNAESAAAYGRALLATLADGPGSEEGLRLSASQRALAGRSAAEYVGIELLGIVFDRPPLIYDPSVSETLGNIEGPVALAAAAVHFSMHYDTFDREMYLRRCPALLHPFSADRLGSPLFGDDVGTAMSQATALVARLRGA